MEFGGDGAGEEKLRLADFIEQRMPDILQAWESFARTLMPAAEGMDAAGLRDHAEQMLQAMARDLRTPQSVEQQLAKSRGELATSNALPQTAAEIHAVLRATDGFSIQQLVSEYRALRASVLRLYGQAHATGSETLEDIGRFNEAVDQAIAESVEFYSSEVERWRNVFLGVLGHDLRGPLNAILLTSRAITRLTQGGPVSEATARLIRSGERMQELLDDLLDYNRSSLHLGLLIKRTQADLVAICQEEVELRRASHPDNDIELNVPGPVEGPWDASRIKQALGNLIDNAARYGSPGGKISVDLRGDETEALLSVQNEGSALPRETLLGLFEPLRRIRNGANDDRANLGLGLFIVREVARAHGGTVTVQSSGGVIGFSLHLPRS